MAGRLQKVILGVVLAGGLSSRFGSDKALAQLAGRSLLTRAVDSLAKSCDKVVIAGRENGPADCIPDWPRAGMGPLGGIAAGLRHAQENHFNSMLTCGVDSAELPDNLLEILTPQPAYLADQPVIGHWPASAAKTVETILSEDGRHSMKAFAEAISARPVKSGAKPANINTPADLAAAEQDHGL